MFTLVSNLIAKAGLGGVFLLMVLENVVPAIPSELILPMAGFDAARGQMDPVLVALVGGIGSALGGIVWYVVGRCVGLERMVRLAGRMGRWAAVTPAELRRADRWFDRWGALVVAVGRCLPGIRGYICIPAGIARMPFARFMVWSTAGALAWSALLVSAGVSLNRHYEKVEQWMNPATEVVLGLCVVVYVVRVATWRPAA
ncbi:MAG: DedA family protein [Caulobacteraceae bacterium]|nr:DedA family protein [Caulobacteraceae bacterium]